MKTNIKLMTLILLGLVGNAALIATPVPGFTQVGGSSANFIPDSQGEKHDNSFSFGYITENGKRVPAIVRSRTHSYMPTYQLEYLDQAFGQNGVAKLNLPYDHAQIDNIMDFLPNANIVVSGVGKKGMLFFRFNAELDENGKFLNITKERNVQSWNAE